MPTTTGLTTADVRRLVLRIADRAPNTKNAQMAPGSASCSYRQETSSGVRHCIVGRLAENLGWDFPMEAHGSSPTAEDAAAECGWPITPKAARWLTKVQVKADGQDVFTGVEDRRRTWGEVASLIRQGDLALEADQVQF